MPLPSNIQSTLNDFFRTLSHVNSYTSIKSTGNKYELYVYSIVHRALSQNYTLVPVGLGSNKEFRFKCSPTPITNNFSYFKFEVRKNEIYGLRNGIEVKGHALEHEIDICVFRKDNFPNMHYPDSSELAVALECKHYEFATALKGEARKYLGTMSDLSVSSGMILKGPYEAGCMHLGHTFFRGFVTNVLSTTRPDLQDFLSNYALYPRFGILPGTIEESTLENDIAAYSSSW